MLDERERARDRRGGHVQDVRGRGPSRRLRVERGALADAEAVLLVDDGDGEAGEADVGLDQRVRADDEAQLAGGELAERCRRGGRRWWSRSAARPGPPRPASAPGSSRSAARRASRSAPSARPASPARRRAASRRGRRRSCRSRPPPSAGAASGWLWRGLVDRPRSRAGLVAGQRERQAVVRASARSAPGGRRGRVPPAARSRRARRRSRASWTSSSSSKASRRRPPSASPSSPGKCSALSAPGGPAAARARAAAPGAARACRRSRRGARASARGCCVESIPSLAGYWATCASPATCGRSARGR